MQSKTIDVWVGLFVIAGILALLFLALKAGNLASFSTDATYRVTARFDNIGGLKPRAPVKAAGVVIGRVVGIRFDDKTYNAVADIDLETKYKFPKDSSAKILTSGLLGEQYLGLEAGGDPAMLANNDRITNTQSAVVLENLISQFLFNKAAEGSSDTKDNKP
jgi:phospholipid/cholesterol/gamma-HCH transport system substrate-binding protein